MGSTSKSDSISRKTKAGSGKHWYNYLRIASLAYQILGFFSIMFIWPGLICFLVPLFISLSIGSKLYCNRYCGREQLFSIIKKTFRLSFNRPIPNWMRSRTFCYGFPAFFLVMFCQVFLGTYLVFRGRADLKQVVTVLQTSRLPWNYAHYATGLPLWISQPALGFHSVMLTSTILGLVAMVLFRPRSWCAYRPMDTMTQMVCKAEAGTQTNSLIKDKRQDTPTAGECAPGISRHTDLQDDFLLEEEYLP